MGTRRPLVAYVDTIRSELLKSTDPKLTLAGFIARLLTFERYRGSGYTVELFRQALFTTLLEATVAPSRLSKDNSLEDPMNPTVDPASGKPAWHSRYWGFLDLMGKFLEHASLDDIDVESFSDSAVGIMTFHQAKGLEFDHTYVTATGRDASVNAVLQTMLFSGQTPSYAIVGDHPTTTSADVLALASADRDREVYVALTRAKSSLTILWDPNDLRPNMKVHAVIARLFETLKGNPHPASHEVIVKEWSNA